MTALRPAALHSSRPTKPQTPHSAQQTQPAGTQSHGKSKQERLLGVGTRSGQGSQDLFLDATAPGKKPLVNGKLVIGGQYADTFGGARVNSQFADPGGTVTSRNDQVSTTFRVDEDDESIIINPRKEPPPTTETPDEEPEPTGPLGDFPPNNSVQPNPMADDAGSGRPLTRDELAREKKHLGRKDDGDDGRTNTEASGSSGGLVTRGKDDRPDQVRELGTVNLNQALAINALVNPIRG